MTLTSIAFTLFLVTNPIGNSPVILALVKDYSFEKQKWILIRETIFSFLLALFFLFLGDIFLRMLNVESYAVTLTGGILLLAVALKMIFPVHNEASSQLKQEPYIVPIATPLLSGPGLLTIIMLYARQENNDIKMTLAISLAWVGVAAVMIAAPYLQRILGKRGLVALEQLMGMILSMIATSMIVMGAYLFLKTLHKG